MKKQRQVDKLRPYRVDYFDIEEMIDNDKALVRSTVVRAVTSAQAQNSILYNDPLSDGYGTFVEGRVIIRSHRFYKKLVHKRDVYKAVEDLFTTNKAIKVMEGVEAYRKAKIDAQFAGIKDDAQFKALAEEMAGWKTIADSPMAKTIGVPPMTPFVIPDKPATGPDSPATQAVLADLQGMTAHDTHEQVMDTFVPDPGQKDISKFEHGDDIAAALTAVAVPDHKPDYVQLEGGGSLPTLVKVLMFVGAATLTVMIALAILHCGH